MRREQGEGSGSICSRYSERPRWLRYQVAFRTGGSSGGRASAFQAQCQVTLGAPTLLASTLGRAGAFRQFPTFQPGARDARRQTCPGGGPSPRSARIRAAGQVLFVPRSARSAAAAALEGSRGPPLVACSGCPARTRDSEGARRDDTLGGKARFTLARRCRPRSRPLGSFPCSRASGSCADPRASPRPARSLWRPRLDGR